MSGEHLKTAKADAANRQSVQERGLSAAVAMALRTALKLADERAVVICVVSTW